MVELSVVLITRNQDWNIARLVQSVMNEAAGLSYEIVLVDSASTDRTVEIALNYPIRIVRLDENQRLTAHKGQYVGYKYSSGKYILFLDGDMELCKGWLEKGLEVIHKEEKIAVVTGPWINLPIEKPSLPENSEMPGLVSERLALYKDTDIDWSHPRGENKIIPSIGGAAMHKRAVLDLVGPFDPDLYCEAEAELCLRIRHAGFQIMRIGEPIAYHYSLPLGVISTLLARRKRNLHLGYGQILRRHFGTWLFWPFVKERGDGCLPLVGAAFTLLCLFLGLFDGSWTLFDLCVMFFVFFVILDTVRKHSFYKTTYSLIDRAVTMEGTVRGFFIPIPRDRYEIKAKVIREINNDPK